MKARVIATGEIKNFYPTRQSGYAAMLTVIAGGIIPPNLILGTVAFLSLKLNTKSVLCGLRVRRTEH